MRKIFIGIILSLAVLFTGCSYVYQNPNEYCEPPAIAMTDVNGNTVCIIGDAENYTAVSNASIIQSDSQFSDDTESSESNNTITSKSDDEGRKTASEYLRELREKMGLGGSDEPEETTENETVMEETDTEAKETEAKKTETKEIENTESKEENVLPVKATDVPKDIPRKVVNEGDLVSFPNLAAYDPDGDELKYTFSAPLNSKGEWQTQVGDAGEYVVTITVSDGSNEVAQQVLVIVEKGNNPPTLEKINDITIGEGEILKISAIASDVDGDTVTISFSEPISSDGTWQTKSGDKGQYQIDATASDGKASTTRSFIVTVVDANKAPIISSIEDITVMEGETVTLTPTVSDPDGDDVKIMYKGWMTESSYKTTYDDAGVHLVTITATDGINSVEESVEITVEEVNRPPKFSSGAFS